MSDYTKNQKTDQDLVIAIKRHDEAAFKELYYRYFKHLIRFAWYRLHCPETSRDLVQEVFYKIWSKREQLDPSKSIKAYLYKILGNMIINHAALSSSKTFSLDTIQEEAIMDDQNDIDVMIDIRSAIDNLPDKLRIVYTLSRIEGFKYEEIAEICGVSVKAVEKRMTQAFLRLRKIFAE
jgi:RNA polymerase sigma-70 factor (ECF subfamily)